MGATTYMILKWNPEVAAWMEDEQARVEAAGSRSAIRAWAERAGVEGTYVAIPLRSFKPVNVSKATGVKITAA
jgi:hypothetical protein